MAYISEFTTDVRHIPGPQNVVADALSRPSVSPPPPFQATVQKSTLKNSAPVLLPPPPFQATVQTSTLKNTSPQFLLASLPISTPIDYVQMASLQRDCTECTQMCNSTVLFVVTKQVGGTLLRGDISGNVFRPLVPVAMRDAVIASVHNVAHPGVEATVRLVSAKFCWP
jgi:hypothetical protein